MGFANAFLIEGDDGLTLIDAGFPDKEVAVFEAIRGLGFSPSQLKHLIFTHGHPDHIGSAAAIVRETGSRTYMLERYFCAVLCKMIPVLVFQWSGPDRHWSVGHMQAAARSAGKIPEKAPLSSVCLTWQGAPWRTIVFKAIGKHLGLKLETQKRPVPVRSKSDAIEDAGYYGSAI